MSTNFLKLNNNKTELWLWFPGHSQEKWPICTSISPFPQLWCHPGLPPLSLIFTKFLLNPSLKLPPKYVQTTMKPSLIASVLPTWATVTFSCLVCLSKPWTQCSMFRTQLPEFLPKHITLTLTCWSLAMMTAKLPVEFRISYRIHLLIYKSQHAFAPQHFSDLLF